MIQVRAAIAHRFISVLLAIFLLKGIAIAFVTPAFSGHDEVMHYAYLHHVAREWQLPVVPDVDAWRANRFAQGRGQPSFDHAPAALDPWAWRKNSPRTTFTTGDWYGRSVASPVWSVTYAGRTYPSGWIYTANHPPLYYLVMTPVYWAVHGLDIEGQLYALRLAAIPFGMVAVLFTWLAIRQLFPGDRFLAITVPAFIAFQPQLAYEASMLNNDILAVALAAVLWYLLARGLRTALTWRWCCLAGLVLGCALLTKSTSVTLVPVIALSMILGIGWRNVRDWVAKGAVVAGVAAAIVWPWYLWMYATYGDLTALDRIRALQWWNLQSAKPRTIVDQLTDPDFAWLRWRETWGEFGWRLVRLDQWLYWAIFWVCAVGIGGLAVWVVRTWRDSQRDRVAIIGVVSSAAMCVIAYGAILQFGTTFVLTQARYAFPALPALALMIMLGYRACIPARSSTIAAGLVVTSLVVLNGVIYLDYVIPYWYP